MDYKENEKQRAKHRKNVEKITDRDIRSNKPNRECQYVCISKKGYVPYDLDKKNQDSVICVDTLKTGIKDERVVIHFFGVADGHGVVGHHVSQFVTKWLPKEIENRLKKIHEEFRLTDDRITDILRDAVLKVARDLEDSDIEIDYSGTTLCCSLIYENVIYTANVGDSQAMICLVNEKNQRAVIDLNVLHKPDDKREKRRIERSGGVVAKLPDLPFEEAGPFRVWNQEITGPGLAMSRSLGDGAAHILGVSSVPTIDVTPLCKDCRYICWASDGVFEFLTSDDVSKIILRHSNIKKMGQAIVNESVKRWRRFDEVVDDISCVLLKLPD